MAKAFVHKIGPESHDEKMRTLWRAKVKIQTETQTFLFRSSEDFNIASSVALRLVETSPSCKMVGAILTGIERVERLWN